MPVIGDDGRREESRQLEPAVAVRRDQHRDLDALVAKPGDTPGPLPLDHGSALERQAELGEKLDGGIEGFYHDAYVVHPLESHFNDLPDRSTFSSACQVAAVAYGRCPLIDPCMRASFHWPLSLTSTRVRRPVGPAGRYLGTVGHHGRALVRAT